MNNQILGTIILVISISVFIAALLTKRKIKKTIKLNEKEALKRNNYD